VRQHLLAEQFERFYQLVGMFRARGLERQIAAAAADLSGGLLQLRDDLARPAAEIDRQRSVDIGRPPPSPGNPRPAAGLLSAFAQPAYVPAYA